MGRHAPALPQYSGKTRETLVFDKLNHLLTPRLGGAIKRHCDDVQETVFGPGNHLRRDIIVTKSDGVVGELSCRAFGHSIPSSKRATAFPATTETSRESRLMQKPTCFRRARKADKYFPSPLHENSQRILERLLQNTAKPSSAESSNVTEFSGQPTGFYRCFASRLSSPVRDRLGSQRGRAQRSRRIAHPGEAQLYRQWRRQRGPSWRRLLRHPPASQSDKSPRGDFSPATELD